MSFTNLPLDVINADSVEEALEGYFVTEEIAGYKCSKCQEAVVARRQTYVDASPELLVLLLKRLVVGKYKGKTS